jgi:hypothetical protein
MRGQFQRLALVAILVLNSLPAFAACEDELSFTLARRVSVVEKPAESEDKERVRIMPVGAITDEFEIKSSSQDGTIEIRKRHESNNDENLEPALVAKWAGQPGSAALLFEAHNQVYVAWVRPFGQSPEIAISKIDNPLEPVFHFALSNIDESLTSGKLTLAPGEKDLLSLQTEKNIYVVAIDQLGGGVEQSGVEQSQDPGGEK